MNKIRDSFLEKEDLNGLECERCGVKKLSVHYRHDGYRQDINNDATAMHTVCDECEYQNCQDI